MNKRQRKKHGKVRVTESSGNVFADLGLPDPEKRLAEAESRLAEVRARRTDRLRRKS